MTVLIRWLTKMLAGRMWSVRPEVEAGIITGCDHRQEWMLDWWWSNYSAHNDQPVAFLDFGLSDEGRASCQARGRVIATDDVPVFDRARVPAHLAAAWEAITDTAIWQSREIWFKKPPALCRSPFSRALWCDLDTEIRGSIAPLLALDTGATGVAICREPAYAEAHARKKGLIAEGQRVFNSGVVRFDWGSSLIAAWAKACAQGARTNMGDQDVLSSLIHRRSLPVVELSPIYNWRQGLGDNPGAVIIHWVGAWGKNHIREVVREAEKRR